jgi:hypothetical protein
MGIGIRLIITVVACALVVKCDMSSLNETKGAEPAGYLLMGAFFLAVLGGMGLWTINASDQLKRWLEGPLGMVCFAGIIIVAGMFIYSSFVSGGHGPVHYVPRR